jgi:hypothetical protein
MRWKSLNQSVAPTDQCRTNRFRGHSMLRTSLLAAIAGAILLNPHAVPAASAEIQKYMRTCDKGMCPYFRASITIPDGWVEDKAASREFDALMLLPAGKDFDNAQAKIYVAVRYNPKKLPVANFVLDAHEQLRDSAKDGRFTMLPEMIRADGKPSYIRYNFEAPSLKEQGYETQAVTDDGDKDGNDFIVTIVLTANSRNAFKAAEPAYLSILSKY